MEVQYNFTIADKPVKVLESAEGITYTILINRTLKDNTFFENLVVEQFGDGEIRANIIKYTPFQPNNVQSYFSAISFNGNRTITPILYNDEMFSDPNAKISMYCYSVCVLICHDLVEGHAVYSHPHTPDGGCANSNSTTIDCTVTCWDNGGGGGGDDAGSGPPLDTPGGGGGPTGNNTPVGDPVNNCGNCNVPIYTAPILEEEEILPNDNFQIPCEGDPVKNPKICSSSPTNKKGGTFGCTRTHPTKTCEGQLRKKKHGGLDIEGKLYDRIYSMYPGTVVSVRSNMEILEYQPNSLGNYVEIESTTPLGTTIRIKYCHLGNIPCNLGDNIPAGKLIGYVGRSGNAAALGVTTHLHLQSKSNYGGIWIETDPINHLDTIFDLTTFEAAGSKSNCN